MAIFPRRTLQRLIIENSIFLLKNQTKRHVDALNRRHKERLGPEWEVVLLNGFSKLGNVTHERVFSGPKKCDIYFESRENPSVQFLADVTAISDAGINITNPFETVWSELIRLARAKGVDPHRFHLHVGTVEPFHGKSGPKVALKLPIKAKLKEGIFNQQFEKLLVAILEKPNVSHEYIITEQAAVTITYLPNQKYASGGHLDYSEIYSLTDNTLSSALRSKVAQLSGTGYKGPRGIFVCDGGSSVLNKTSGLGLSYTTDEVVNHFLKEERSISFVATFVVHPRDSLSKANYYITGCVYKGWHFEKLNSRLQEILLGVYSALPQPYATPINALNKLESATPDEGLSHWGGLTMSSSRVKISSRALLELLAGRVSQQEFFERHGFIKADELPGGHPINPFNNALSGGRLIDNIKIEKCPSDDDDWLVFEMKGPDPAISTFTSRSTTHR